MTVRYHTSHTHLYLTSSQSRPWKPVRSLDLSVVKVFHWVTIVIPKHESEDEDEEPQEESEPASTQDSFVFSVTHSRNTSMTSIGSIGESVNPRKRTLEDMEPSSVQSAPTSLSKARRLSESTRDP